MTNSYMIYQSDSKKAKNRIAISTVGFSLAVTLAIIGARSSTDIVLTLCLSLAVALFGVAFLLTLRKKGEFELFEILDNTAFIKSHHGVVFEGNLTETKLQRVRLPNGTIKVFLRNGVHAVEIGSTLAQSFREEKASGIEDVLKEHRLVNN